MKIINDNISKYFKIPKISPEILLNKLKTLILMAFVISLANIDIV